MHFIFEVWSPHLSSNIILNKHIYNFLIDENIYWLSDFESIIYYKGHELSALISTNGSVHWSRVKCKNNENLKTFCTAARVAFINRNKYCSNLFITVTICIYDGFPHFWQIILLRNIPTRQIYSGNLFIWNLTL